jgi:hypothetical protein
MAGGGRRIRGRSRRSGAALTLAAVLALGGGLAACSSSSSTGTTTTGASTATTGTTADATALAARCTEAMKALSTFRVTGSVVTSGQDLTVDMVLSQHGMQGTFTTSKGTFQIITITGTVYMEADHSFWASQGLPDASAQLLAGKWLSGLPASATQGLANSFTINQILGSLDSTGAVTDVGTSTIAGQSAIGLKGSDGSVGYVAATGTPYLLKVVSPHDGAQGALTFSEFGTATAPTAPTGAIDFSSLAG